MLVNTIVYSFSKFEMDDYFVYRKCILTYKVLNSLTPEYLNVFQYVSQVSSRITRPSVNNLLFVPKAKTEYYRRSFVISSCNLWNLWNNMSDEMRESTSLEIFKTKYVNE
jgi:hypothetical protein